LSSDQLRLVLQIKQAETTRRIEEERARLARIEAWLRDAGSDPGARPDVVVKRIDAQSVASIRDVLATRGDVARLFQALAVYQRRHGLNATSWTVVWHDPDFREAEVDAEATFATTDPLPSDERVRRSELPAVEAMACVVHHGPPESIGSSCQTLLQWIDTNRRQIAGPERVRMIQRGGPGGADDIVELQVPVV